MTVAGVGCMSRRRKKLEIGNSLGNYCNRRVRANEDLIGAVAIGAEEGNDVGDVGSNIARA